MGYEGRTASSTVPEEAVPRLRAAGGRVKPGSKPKATTEDLRPRPRARGEVEQTEGTSAEDSAVPEPDVESGAVAPTAAAEPPPLPEAPSPAPEAPAVG